jgi:hypothetical protein
MVRAVSRAPQPWHGTGKVPIDRAWITRWIQLDRQMPKPVTATVRMPARAGVQEEARETLSLLHGCRQTINLVLVALSDGVELEVWADGALRRRARFLRDSEARKYSGRLSARLARRGYRKGWGPS